MRGTSTFICGWMNPIAAAHCAALAGALQFAGFTAVPVELAMEDVVMRFNPGKLRLTISTLVKKNSLSLMMGPPSVPPAWWRHSGAL